MKRSEMILNIASELVREESNFISWDKAQILAEHVLKRIEKEGMLPPSQLFKNIPWGFQCEWEPETEDSFSVSRESYQKWKRGE